MSVLVIDIGTTSTRGALFTDNGQLKEESRFLNEIKYEANGKVNASPSCWKEGIIHTIKSIVDKCGSDDIEAIAVTGARSSITPLDVNGEPLMDTIMWLDSRNRELVERLAENNELFKSKTGSIINTTYSGGKMSWIKENRPEIYEKTYKMLNVPEYVMYVMTGVYCSDYTYGSRTGLLNLETKIWDKEILEIYGLDEDKLCTLYEPGSVVGQSTAEFEKLTGLKEGTKVITAGGDQQCGSIGQGLVNVGNISLNLGTGAYITGLSDDLREARKAEAVINYSSLKDRFVIETSIQSCSSAFDWCCRNLYGMKENDYEFTHRELESYPGVTECLVLPYFQGKGSPEWDSSVTASIYNITLKTTRTEVFKSVMEGVFMEINNHLIKMLEVNDIDVINVSGGISKEELLVQLLSDVTGKRIRKLNNTEATLNGALAISWVTLNKCPDEETGLIILKNGEDAMYYPNAVKHEMYLDKQRIMNKLFEHNREVI